MNAKALTRYAWFTLWFNVVVILVGAVVRATGSGAGCGRSWPGCHGTFVPVLEGDTVIEYSHRVVSGIALALVFVLAILVRRSHGKGHPARLGAGLSVVAIIGEALIGAMLVLAEWVAHDTSVARVVAVSLHLVNTLFLLAVLTLTAFWVSGNPALRWSGATAGVRRVIAGAGAALAALAATGAITALADTLFPKDGFLGSGTTDEEHFLTSLRIVHPILALALLAIAWVVVSRTGSGDRYRWVPWLVGALAVSGVVNVLLGVPLWTQILHLALADGLWIAFVWLSATVLALPEREPAPA